MKITSIMVFGVKRGLSENCHRFFSTLANPTRLAVLENLMKGPMNVSQLSVSLEQELSMISHNLRPLVQCGFVQVKRRGKERVYSINHETMYALFKIVENHDTKFCLRCGECTTRRS